MHVCMCVFAHMLVYWVWDNFIICVSFCIWHCSQVTKQLNHHENYLCWLWITTTHLPSEYTPFPEASLYLENVSLFLLPILVIFFTAKGKLWTYINKESLFSFRNLARRVDYDTHALVIFFQFTINNIWLWNICKIITWFLIHGKHLLNALSFCYHHHHIIIIIINNKY